MVDASLDAFGRSGYTDLVQWFGPPPDPQWQYRIVLGTRTLCRRQPLKRRYTISISPRYASHQERCWAVGHEMYHRVTMLKWPQSDVWVDEMLACVSSLRLLRDRGYGVYADDIARSYRQSQSTLDMASIEAMQRGAISGRLLGPMTEDALYAAVTAVGEGMVALVGWSAVCELARNATLGAWMRALPDERADLVAHFLKWIGGPYLCEKGGHHQSRIEPSGGPRVLLRLAYACYTAGRYEASIELYRRALRTERHAPSIHYWLGYAHLESGAPDAAEAAWLTFLSAEPDNAAIHYNLGNICRQRGDLEAAAAHLQRAVQAEPRDASSRFYLGVVLRDMGRRAEARYHWAVAATFGEPVVSPEAQRLLNEDDGGEPG